MRMMILLLLFSAAYSAASSYRFYRWKILKPGYANRWSLQAFRFLEQDGTEGVPVLVNHKDGGLGKGMPNLQRAFNSVERQMGQKRDTVPAWGDDRKTVITVDFGLKPVFFTQYKIHLTNTNQCGDDPQEWEFYASNNAVHWVRVAYEDKSCPNENQSVLDQRDWNTFNFDYTLDPNDARASGTVPEAENMMYLVVGTPLLNCQEPKHQCSTRLAPKNEKHAVKCCSDTAVAGWMNTGIQDTRKYWCKNWHMEADNNCKFMTWDEGNAYCAAKGHRLCTRSEFETYCVKGGGRCNWDSKLVWTSSSAVGDTGGYGAAGPLYTIHYRFPYRKWCGNPIKRYTSVQGDAIEYLDQCRQKCTDDASCKYVMWKDDGRTNKFDCSLFDVCDTTKREPYLEYGTPEYWKKGDAVAAARSSGPGALSAPNCVQNKGYIDANNRANTKFQATSWQNCKTECLKENSKYFAYRPAGNWCKCAKPSLLTANMVADNSFINQEACDSVSFCVYDMACTQAATGSPPGLAACPVSMTSALLTACNCEGEATECAVGKFCYTGGCKDSPQCTVRTDVEKSIFYGAKVYGSWNASTKIMSMNFTTPFDVTLNSIAWKNAASQQLKYSKSAPGLWTKDTSNSCQPTYKLDVAQTTFFGDGSKFKITGSQLSTNLRVDASETVTTVKNAQTYTYTRSIKNTVPVLVNLITKTTIAVRFRSTMAPKGPGKAPALEDFVLFIAAEDNFATNDPNVLITMQVHSRTCVDHTLPNTGVRVTTGIGNIKSGRASEFTWTKEASGDRKRDFVHNLCVEELQWKFVPEKYTENSYEIDLEFTLRVDQGSATAAEKFTTTAAIDIKQGDVLSDIGFTSAITPYEDANCTVQQSKFRLGQKFWTKIVLTDLVVPTHNITCNTYKIKQTKNGQTTETDLKNEAKYNFVEIKSADPANSHICGAELESHHFHVSVDGYDTLLETEILITYDQTNTRRKLVQIPFTKDMWEAAGYDMEYEYAIGAAELSEEDLKFQNTKRAPDQDDMVVDLFIEAEKSVGIFVSEEAMSSLGQMLMLSAVVAGAGYAFGFFHTKAQEGDYSPMIEM